jgi:hypothetical protein
MSLHVTQEAADKTLTNLADAGLAGAILAIMVAPVLLVLVRGSQKRQEATDARDERDAVARRERESRLVDALVASVQHQKEAIAQWREFESEEKVTHQAILANLGQLTATLAQIASSIRHP